MKKIPEIIFTVIKIPTDWVLLILAGLGAYYIRFEENVTDIRPVIFDIKPQEILLLSGIVASIWILFFALAGLYKFRKYNITDEIGKIILACSTGMSAVIIYMFFIREIFDSRFIILTAWFLSIIFVTIGRIILRKIQHFVAKKGIGTHKLIIIGKNKETEEIINTIKKQPELGYKIIAHITEINSTTFEKLTKLHKKTFIDEIMQADSTVSRKDSIDLINFAEENNILFKYAAGTFEARSTNIEVHMISGVPIIEIKKTKLDGWGKVIKRMIDLFYSILLLIIFILPMLLIALAIKLESRGPVIYKNERVSKKGNFNVYKFRSMYSHYCIGKQFEKYTDQKKILEFEQKLIQEKSKRQGPVYKIINDPRRTKIGKFLEKTSLDELPQLFNVFIGNLSLVGPRPHQKREVEKYTKHHKRVLDIKPGVSGLAQISGRSDLDFDEEVKLDIYYIENWSLKLDFWIMLKTPFVILTRK
jgi:exopolysaccharide biosynthesis polyprenyl glycosylphosphotransferase